MVDKNIINLGYSLSYLIFTQSKSQRIIMKSLTFLFTLLFVAACGQTNPDPDKSIDDPRMQWYMDAKLGLMVHWGVYAVPAGSWSEDGTFESWKKAWESGTKTGLREYGGYAEQIMRHAAIPRDEYKKLPQVFDWSDFNAQEYIDLCYATGQKYIVITSKHHDGFAMYHSKADPFNIVETTPTGQRTGRDPLKELAEACAATKTKGPWEIKMCFYYSHCVDWMEDGTHDHGYKHATGPDAEKFQEYFDRKFYPQVKELMENYGEVGLIWFDVPRIPFTDEQAKKVVDMMKSIQPNTLVNGRLGKTQFVDYMVSGDNGVAGVPTDYYWETPASINHSYGYSAHDEEWKTWEALAEWFVKTISHNGNYLLNIGPKADGSIPEKSVEIMHRLGEWVKPHSEAIFGTRSSPYKGPSMTSMEWGYTTQKDNNLYLFVRYWPEDGKLDLPLLKNKIKNISFLVANDGAKLDYKYTTDHAGNKITSIAVPKEAPTEGITVIKVEVKGDEIQLDRIKHYYNEESKQIILEARDFHAIVGQKSRINYNRSMGAIQFFWAGKGKDPGEMPVWQIDVKDPGKYKMEIEYSSHPQLGAGKVNKVFIDDAEVLSFKGKSSTGEHTDPWYNFGTFEIGELNLNQGVQNLRLAAYETEGTNSSWNIAIKRIRLTKVD
jgi:alpha-L-fucosidase